MDVELCNGCCIYFCYDIYLIPGRSNWSILIFCVCVKSLHNQRNVAGAFQITYFPCIPLGGGRSSNIHTRRNDELTLSSSFSTSISISSSSRRRSNIRERRCGADGGDEKWLLLQRIISIDRILPNHK